MQTSESINELAAALATAQGVMVAPKKDRTVKVQTKMGGSYTFSYATFDSIVECARKPLADAGIAFVQAAELDEQNVTVETRLIHKSGQWLASTIAAHSSGGGPQELGSLISYLKRYALSALLGIVADEDDDGNAASGNEAQRIEGSKRGSAQGRAMEQGSAPAKEESQAAAFKYAQTVLAEAGVFNAPSGHLQNSLYLSWLRTCYEQALGRDISKILALSASELRIGANKIVTMIRDKAVQPWQPAEVSND